DGLVDGNANSRRPAGEAFVSHPKHRFFSCGHLLSRPQRMGAAADGSNHSVPSHYGAVCFRRRKSGAYLAGGRQELWRERLAAIYASYPAGGVAASLYRVPPRSGSRIHRHRGRRNGRGQIRSGWFSLAFVADPTHRRDVRWTNAYWFPGNFSDLWAGSPRGSVNAMASRSVAIEGTAIMARRGARWRLIISPVLLLLVWELLAAVGVLRPNYVPPPSQLGPHLVELLAGGELWRHLSVTLYRLGLSFIFALLPGWVCGLSLGMSRSARLALEPILTSLYAIPKIALLPLVMLVLGVNERTLVFTSSLTSFVQMTISTTGGVLAVDRSILEAGKNYGATGWRLFRYVLLPSALPDIFTGMRIGLALTLVLVIAVEFTAAQEGPGAFLWTAGQTLSAKNMFSTFTVIGALGWILSYGLERIGNRLIPWPQRSRPAI